MRVLRPDKTCRALATLEVLTDEQKRATFVLEHLAVPLQAVEQEASQATSAEGWWAQPGSTRTVVSLSPLLPGLTATHAQVFASASELVVAVASIIFEEADAVQEELERIIDAFMTIISTEVCPFHPSRASVVIS